ncbi:hypothetical protein HHI36_002632 [Cryptolaemus montrouzieri]|uniref:Uncharacterized protein n=1 Tax=Cryptolaemus montrouzieri TaxID=559131 RepID=A0ABD2PBM4_9CUCU
MNRLNDEYKRKGKLEFSVYPWLRVATSVVEPYNDILTAHTTMDYSNCTFLMDAEATFDICSSKLGLERPNYVNLNRLVAQIVLSTTTSLRYVGEGMEKGEFTEAREDLAALEKDYEEISRDFDDTDNEALSY